MFSRIVASRMEEKVEEEKKVEEEEHAAFAKRTRTFDPSASVLATTF